MGVKGKIITIQRVPQHNEKLQVLKAPYFHSYFNIATGLFSTPQASHILITYIGEDSGLTADLQHETTIIAKNN